MLAENTFNETPEPEILGDPLGSTFKIFHGTATQDGGLPKKSSILPTEDGILPTKDSSLPTNLKERMAYAELDSQGLWLNAEGDRTICDINDPSWDPSVEGCTKCISTYNQLKEAVTVSCNWLTGHREKTPSWVSQDNSRNYKNYLNSKTLVEQIIQDLPPSNLEGHQMLRKERDMRPQDPLKELGTHSGSKQIYSNAPVFFLTYAYQFQTDNYIKTISSHINSKGSNILRYAVAKETGSTGHIHTHVLLILSSKLLIRSTKFFDYTESTNNPADPKWCHPNIRWIHREDLKELETQITNLINYCSKFNIPETNITDTEINQLKEGIFFSTNNINLGKERPTKSKFHTMTAAQVIEHHSQASLVQAIIDSNVDPRAASRLEDFRLSYRKSTIEPKPFEGVVLNDWQTFMAASSLIQSDRVVIWVYDPQGGSGKSFFSTYMRRNHKCLTISLSRLENVVTILKDYTDKHGTPKAIYIDVVRDSGVEVFNSIYRIVETLKLLQPTSGKYQSCVIDQEFSPQVVVMSNSLPDILKLSQDRWAVLVMGVDGNVFDYSYTGSNGKEFIEATQTALKDVLPYPIRCSQDITDMPPFSYLTIENRMSFWDRGVFPVFTIIKSLSCKFKLDNEEVSFKVEEKPLTKEEIEEYQAWKVRFLNNTSRITNYHDQAMAIKAKISPGMTNTELISKILN
jgi:hypothetical protein